jgi:AcrR family transcriptional regulator
MAAARGSTALERDRIIAAAVELADEIGAEALTIRKLADALDAKPMTLYSYIDGKDDILDGMVDQVFAEIDLPDPELPWRAAVRGRCVSAREVLSRHTWAVPLLESRRSPGHATLEHHDAMLGCLFRGGLPVAVVAHAYAVLDAFVYGFAIQEASLPATEGSEMQELAQEMASAMPADVFPHLARFTIEHVTVAGYTFGASFEVGLDVLLDGIERLAADG